MTTNRTPPAVQTEVARLVALIGSTSELAVYMVAIRDLEHLANVQGRNFNVDGENEILGIVRQMKRTHGKRITALVDAASPYSIQNYYAPRNTKKVA